MAAAVYPGALMWKNGATFSSEIVNRQQHGHGVMVFRASGREAARYAGAFDHGRRIGLGIGTSDGLVWIGQRKDD